MNRDNSYSFAYTPAGRRGHLFMLQSPPFPSQGHHHANAKQPQHQTPGNILSPPAHLMTPHDFRHQAQAQTISPKPRIPFQPLTPLPLPTPHIFGVSSPPDCLDSPMSPTDKLEYLLDIILSVLRSYSELPIRSPIYLSSLHDFHHRGLALHPAPAAYIRATEPDPEEDDNNNAGDDGGRRGSVKKGRSPIRRMSTISAMTKLEREPPQMDEVEELEVDWWNSEVVAAWFGPRPQAKTGRRGRRGAGTGIRGVSVGSRAPMDDAEGSLKRHASYVGLNDEGFR